MTEENQGSPQQPDNQTQHQPQENNVGKSMIIIAWVIALLLLTWIFGVWEDRQVNPNHNPQSMRHNDFTQVVLQRNRYGHYMVSGEIDGQSTRFMLDTGATLVAIPGELESKLGLKRGWQHYTHTANGTAVAYDTEIAQLKIGGIVLNQVKAAIVPSMQGEEVLLGMSVLKELEFSQKGDQLTLKQYR